ncbi:MAG: DUF1501 domain-containing protein [Acidobacteriota bacterium]|nr:DUF1501 domain-containing protein [Acidobacteriota bacterium]
MIVSRRRFMGQCAAVLAGSSLLPAAAHDRFRVVKRTGRSVQPQHTARNLIFIHLNGGPSQVDTFDLKRGSWTPDNLGAETIGNLDWPSGAMPKLAAMTDRFSLIRGMSALEPVHGRASFHLLSTYRQNPAFQADIPHFMALLTSFLASTRGPDDLLPFSVTTAFPFLGTGRLPRKYAPTSISENGSIPNLTHPWDDAEDRFSLLQGLTGQKRRAADARASFKAVLNEASRMSQSEELKAYSEGSFNPSTTGEFYKDFYMNQARAATRILTAGFGTRLVMLDFFGWDHHDRIYGEFGVRDACLGLDEALAYLLNTLEEAPGSDPAKTLLDETMIVAVGEFGRTPGEVDGNGGRDHYPYLVPAFVAGGGIQPGRIIGASDETGSYVTDPGWSHGRDITFNDLIATIYSALGLDWTAQLRYTPTGRLYDVVDTSQYGSIHAIDELFV